MSEQTPEQLQAELETLRRTNAELLEKSRTRKARVGELEGKLTETEAKVQELIRNRPLKQLAAAISVAPDALITSFLSDYRVELEGANLVLQTLDGKPVLHEGKTVPFEPEAIKALLFATKDDAKLRLYNSILIVSRASGAATQSATMGKVESKSALHFGLK